MKRMILAAIALMLAIPVYAAPSASAGLAAAATESGSVTFTWSNVNTTGTVTLYKASAACSTNPTTFTPIQTGIASAGPYEDNSTVNGTAGVSNYCYYVTAVVNGAESIPSNKVSISVTVLPQPPTGLAGTTNP